MLHGRLETKHLRTKTHTTYVRKFPCDKSRVDTAPNRRSYTPEELVHTGDNSYGNETHPLWDTGNRDTSPVFGDPRPKLSGGP